MLLLESLFDKVAGGKTEKWDPGLWGETREPRPLGETLGWEPEVGP